jgi:hypothetical protein
MTALLLAEEVAGATTGGEAGAGAGSDAGAGVAAGVGGVDGEIGDALLSTPAAGVALVLSAGTEAGTGLGGTAFVSVWA